jgi:hypothetical protein
MSKWEKISLLKFQQMQVIYDNPNYDDQDKVFHNICVAYDIEPAELNNGGFKNAYRLIQRFNRDFGTEPKFEPKNRIKKFQINYEPSQMAFGQYITLAFYLARNAVLNCHKILATITNEYGFKYNADTQQQREDYFLTRPVTEVVGSIKRIQDKYRQFNDGYKSLFGLNTDNAQETETDVFHKRFGWVFSATMVADHNRITLDQAYALPVRVAFNDLAYLKAKAAYDEKQFKRR